MGVARKNVIVAMWVVGALGGGCGSGLERVGTSEAGADEDVIEREVEDTEAGSEAVEETDATEDGREISDVVDVEDGAEVDDSDDGEGASETEARDGEENEAVEVEVDAAGQCAGAPDDAACDDGNACTTGERCVGGACRARGALSCDDRNPCTDDRCAPAEGCVFTNNLAGCDDGDACTAGDRCVAGSCRAGGPKCDDGNPCTRDACDGAGACDNTPDDSLPCEDASVCSGDDFCANGVCVGGMADGCQRVVAGDTCATAACGQDGLTCEVTLLNGVVCDDGNACTVGDRCVSGFCQPVGSTDCGWDVACARFHCDRDTGCVLDEAYDAGKTCSDSDDCTLGDACDGAGACVPEANRVCEDNNPCTENRCYSWFGCSFSARSGPCDDGNACTTGDSCDFGVCRGAGLLSCDDGDPCTLDSCDPMTGCERVDATCNDGNPCTIDTCEAPHGCRFVAREGGCEDGLGCTTGDACVAGACVGAVACDDGDPCTIDVCDPEEGCVGDPICDALAGEGCDGVTCVAPASRLAVTAIGGGPVRVTITNQSLASFRLGGFVLRNGAGDEGRIAPREVVIGPGEALVGVAARDLAVVDADFIIEDEDGAWAPEGATTLLTPGGETVMTFEP